MVEEATHVMITLKVKTLFTVVASAYWTVTVTVTSSVPPVKPSVESACSFQRSFTAYGTRLGLSKL